MQHYLITYLTKYKGGSTSAANAVTDLHPADWLLAKRDGAKGTVYVLVSSMEITAAQYERFSAADKPLPFLNL